MPLKYKIHGDTITDLIAALAQLDASARHDYLEVHVDDTDGRRVVELKTAYCMELSAPGDLPCTK